MHWNVVRKHDETESLLSLIFKDLLVYKIECLSNLFKRTFPFSSLKLHLFIVQTFFYKKRRWSFISVSQSFVRDKRQLIMIKKILFVWGFSSHWRICHSYLHVRPLISEGTLVCHTSCDTGHLFIMVISYTHTPSIWQCSYHYTLNGQERTLLTPRKKIVDWKKILFERVNDN